MLREVAHCVRQSVRVSEGHEAPGPRREHVLGVPVRCRDRGAARGDRERERARGDLLAVAVRRHEHVGGGEQIGQLVDREEAVVELDVVAETEIDHAALELQAVLLPLPARHPRMGSPCDQVEHLGMALDDRRQRVDRHLEPFPGRDQPEGGEQEPLLHALVPAGHRGHVERAPSGGLLLAPPGKLHRRTVRHDPDLAVGARSDFDEQPLRSVGHHDHELGVIAERGEHLELMRRRLRQHRVQGHDERLGQLLGEGQHVLAVGAAEDPELVLEEHDVDVEPADEPSCAHVVTANAIARRSPEARDAAGSTARRRPRSG